MCQMNRTLLVVAIALLYSSASLSAERERASAEFQYTLANYHEFGDDGAKPIAWVRNYGQFTNKNVTMDRRRSALGIGLGVTPLFDTYGFFRTSSKHNKSTYVALGFIADEMAADEAGTSVGKDYSGLSYGFGVSNSSFNFEYMMSVDQGNYDVSAIGMSFISEF